MLWLIISLIIVGGILLVAELVLLPGMSIAGIGGFVSYGIAIYLGFSHYDTTGGAITIGVIVAVTILLTVISLRARTWRRFSLDNKIDGTSQPLPENELKIGDKGVTVTRLAPAGKVTVGEETYEARSLGDIYVDPRTDVEVVGFENFTVIVKVGAE